MLSVSGELALGTGGHGLFPDALRRKWRKQMQAVAAPSERLLPHCLPQEDAHGLASWDGRWEGWDKEWIPRKPHFIHWFLITSHLEFISKLSASSLWFFNS